MHLYQNTWKSDMLRSDDNAAAVLSYLNGSVQGAHKH